MGVYSDPERDPRGHNVSVAFLVRVLSGELAAASDAAEVAVLDPASVELAFDHSKIIEDALSLMRLGAVTAPTIAARSLYGLELLGTFQL